MSWLRKVFSSRPYRTSTSALHRPTSRARSRPRLDLLEDRILPTVSFSNGTLLIGGDTDTTNENDKPCKGDFDSIGDCGHFAAKGRTRPEAEILARCPLYRNFTRGRCWPVSDFWVNGRRRHPGELIPSSTRQHPTPCRPRSRVN